jgi:peroxiredoxin/tetratricopeptide (TPR) repeat protein
MELWYHIHDPQKILSQRPTKSPSIYAANVIHKLREGQARRGFEAYPIQAMTIQNRLMIGCTCTVGLLLAFGGAAQAQQSAPVSDGAAALAAQAETSGDRAKARHLEGHSKLGEAFDEGPREKPSKIAGIGSTNFPITTKNPEAQMWFNQGHTLLHSFWYYEGERSFRWASKLDPDAPMPYWGLMRAAGGGARAKSFWKEADKRKAHASQRERDYIEAWSHQYSDDAPSGGDRRAFTRALERLVMTYPDDVEAKAVLGNETMGRERVGTEALMQQVLKSDSNHPGAHHYRIHNWDDEDGAFALDSLKKYGTIAPGIGHALHMPGHIYAGIGMFHESAISLDSATRAEINYMGRQMVFPYNTWNYAHNRNYLSYVQEQLGLPSEAIRGARELLAMPLDPKLNDQTRYSPHWQGVSALTRALVKFEKWDEILKDGSIPWGTSIRDKMSRPYAEALAHIGKGDLAEARKAIKTHTDMKAEVEKPENRSFRRQFEVQDLELRAAFAAMRGEAIEAISLLSQGAPKEIELRQEYDDPPYYPNILWTKLGALYLANDAPKLAVEAFDLALKAVPNDPFALAGLTAARHTLNDQKAAAEAYGRLRFVWSDAEPGNRWLDKARSLGLKSEPIELSPGPQRNYRRTTLDHLGSAIWQPFTAPQLTVTDPTGKRLTLEQFRGRNVILVFYLGQGCAHCVTQVKELADRSADWAAQDTDVITVSQDTPEMNAKSQQTSPLKLTLASDEKYANAHRFKSFDDFEELPFHSTILIDKDGRVHWARHGGGPFTDYKFLLAQLQRMNKVARPAPTNLQ